MATGAKALRSIRDPADMQNRGADTSKEPGTVYNPPQVGYDKYRAGKVSREQFPVFRRPAQGIPGMATIDVVESTPHDPVTDPDILMPYQSMYDTGNTGRESEDQLTRVQATRDMAFVGLLKRIWDEVKYPQTPCLIDCDYNGLALPAQPVQVHFLVGGERVYARQVLLQNNGATTIYYNIGVPATQGGFTLSAGTMVTIDKMNVWSLNILDLNSNIFMGNAAGGVVVGAWK